MDVEELHPKPTLGSLPLEILSDICIQLVVGSKSVEISTELKDEIVLLEAEERHGGSISQENGEISNPLSRAQERLREQFHKGLCSLCITNRRCNAVATDHLYARVLFQYKEGQIVDNILGTLLTNQRIASRVKMLEAGSDTYAQTEIPMSQSTIQAIMDATLHRRQMISKSRSLIPTRELSNWPQVADRQYYEYDKTLMSLLIHEELQTRLENLQSLTVVATWSKNTLKLLPPEASEVTHGSALSRLLHYRHINSDENPGDLEYPLRFISKHRVEQVQLYMCEHVSFDAPNRRPGFASIKCLELIRCALSKNAFERVLGHCSELSIFSYTVDYRDSSLEERISLPELIALLQNHKSTLEELRLIVNAVMPYGEWGRRDYEELEGRDILPCLRDFKSLRRFCVDRFDLTRGLAGDFSELYPYNADDEMFRPDLEEKRPVHPSDFLEKLPSSLEVLGISRVTSSIIPMLVKATTLPNLRAMQFVPCERKDIVTQQKKCKPIEKACRRHKLQISYGLWKPPLWHLEMD